MIFWWAFLPIKKQRLALRRYRRFRRANAQRVGKCSNGRNRAIEFEIITGDDEHYDLWLSEKELRLADDGKIGAFTPRSSQKIDPDKDIFEYWKKLSQTGDAEAQNNLGLMYYGGNGTEKDEELALKYFQLAAEQGHADAQENLRLLQEVIAVEKVLNKRSQNKE